MDFGHKHVRIYIHHKQLAPNQLSDQSQHYTPTATEHLIKV